MRLKCVVEVCARTLIQAVLSGLLHLYDNARAVVEGHMEYLFVLVDVKKALVAIYHLFVEWGNPNCTAFFSFFGPRVVRIFFETVLHKGWENLSELYFGTLLRFVG